MSYEFLKSKKKGDILFEAGYGSMVELELLEDITWAEHEEYGDGFKVMAKSYRGEVRLSGYSKMSGYGPNLSDWPHYAGPLYKIDGTVVQN